MVVFPCAKINLGLHIVGRRPDGYHNLETVFYPIPLCDILEAVPLPGGRGVTLHQSGLVPDGAAEDNLVVRAYRLVEKRRTLPAVEVCLHKNIPSGAGMGGGSSDATAMLLLLDRLFRLGLTPEELAEDALALGADCPFFLTGGPAFARGTGNLLEPLPVDLSAYRMAVVKPPLFVSTADAFRGVTPRPALVSLRRFVAEKPVGEWRGALRNDFEDSLFPRFPLLAETKEKLYADGALYASMTGSGSAFFALYPPASSPEAESALLRSRLSALFPGFFVWTDEPLD